MYMKPNAILNDPSVNLFENVEMCLQTQMSVQVWSTANAQYIDARVHAKFCIHWNFPQDLRPRVTHTWDGMGWDAPTPNSPSNTSEVPICQTRTILGELACPFATSNIIATTPRSPHSAQLAIICNLMRFSLRTFSMSELNSLPKTGLASHFTNPG